jgi:serine/threonine protein kinase
MDSSRLPDLVRDTRLETEFRGNLTIHTHGLSESLRRGKKERIHWERVKEIGRGGFGSVHLETRRGPLNTGQPELRAVKRMRHATHRRLTHELEAIAKFSNEKVCCPSMDLSSILTIDQYESCFVKSFGWYETEDCLYIAMEYLPSGDLYKCLSDKPALSERDAQDITFQILEGVYWMHDNDFAHRDLKPQVLLSCAICFGPGADIGVEYPCENRSA